MSEQQNIPVAPVNEQEQKLIKATFKDNDHLLQVMRALFLNLGVSSEDKKLIKDTFSSKELMEIMWKRFCPSLSKESPIGQVQDVWLGAENMVFGQHEGAIKQAIGYKEKSINLVRTALGLLQEPESEPIDLSYTSAKYTDDVLGIELLTRNQYIRHIESQLLGLKIVASQKDETPTQQSKRIAQNSSQ